MRFRHWRLWLGFAIAYNTLSFSIAHIVIDCRWVAREWVCTDAGYRLGFTVMTVIVLLILAIYLVATASPPPGEGK